MRPGKPLRSFDFLFHTRPTRRRDAQGERGQREFVIFAIGGWPLWKPDHSSSGVGRSRRGRPRKRPAILTFAASILSSRGATSWSLTTCRRSCEARCTARSKAGDIADVAATDCD